MPKNRSSCGKINIGLDFDGVIVNNTPNKIRAAKTLGFKIKAEQTPSEVLKKLLPKKKYKLLQSIVYGKITMKAPLMPFAFRVIKKLSRGNHNLCIISRRKGKTSKIALVWLKKHHILKFIPQKKIFFVKEDRSKDGVAKKLKVEVYLDDKIAALEYLSSVPHRVFFNPYLVPINSKFSEINSWKDFYRLLEKIKKGAKEVRIP